MVWALSYPLRDWQEKAILNWSNNSNRGIAKVVTGGGKTYFAMMCILNLRKTNDNVNYLIVVPTLALRDQWLLDIIEGLNVPREEIYCHGIDKKVLKRHRIIIMVINSARTKGRSLTSSGEWMLIVDECHRAASEENRKSLEGDWLATLGLSATPERQYDEWFSEHLIPKLGPIISEYNYKILKDETVNGIECYVLESIPNGIKSEYSKYVSWISKDKNAYKYLPNSVNAFESGCEFIKKLEESGFKQCEHLPLTFGIVSLYVAIK